MRETTDERGFAQRSFQREDADERKRREGEMESTRKKRNLFPDLYPYPEFIFLYSLNLVYFLMISSPNLYQRSSAPAVVFFSFGAWTNLNFSRESEGGCDNGSWLRQCVGQTWTHNPQRMQRR